MEWLPVVVMAVVAGLLIVMLISMLMSSNGLDDLLWEPTERVVRCRAFGREQWEAIRKAWADAKIVPDKDIGDEV